MPYDPSHSRSQHSRLLFQRQTATRLSVSVDGTCVRILRAFLRHEKIHESGLTIHTEFGRTSAQTHNIRVLDILYTLYLYLIRDEVQIGGGRFRGRSRIIEVKTFSRAAFSSLLCRGVLFIDTRGQERRNTTLFMTCKTWEMTPPRCRSTYETPNGLWRARSFSHFKALHLLLLIYNQANH